jgi:1,4-alpha-glucan branching enzyme
MNYRELADGIVEYCREMQYTHVELLPVTEHPFTGSWGYQSTGYFAATRRFGAPDDFRYFVDRCHQNEIGVIIDFVPAHFPRDAHGLARFDGSALYEHEDPRQGEHPDWGTLIFNYGRNEVRNFLIASALFWLRQYHVDGLRVDAVASMLYLDYSRQPGQWIPNRYGGRENLEAIEFLKQLNYEVHRQHPGVLTIAEESTAWPGVSRPVEHGGLGFSLKWNMGWMNDTLRYMRRQAVHRRFHQNDMTFSMMYAYSENFLLPFSHDEMVHGKGSLLGQMPGDDWQKFANLRLLLAYQWTHPGKKLLFMGGDFGQWSEWNWSQPLPWDLLQWGPHIGIKQLVRDLNGLMRGEPALYEVDFHPAGFEWIDCHNARESTLSYIRRAAHVDDYLVVCCNFTPVVREHFPIGVPEVAVYRELLNTDAAVYGGSNVLNDGGRQSEPGECLGRPARLTLTLPPLGAVILKRVTGADASGDGALV